MFQVFSSIFGFCHKRASLMWTQRHAPLGLAAESNHFICRANGRNAFGRMEAVTFINRRIIGCAGVLL